MEGFQRPCVLHGYGGAKSSMPTTHLKNISSKLDSISPNFRDENKKYLKPPPSGGFWMFFFSILLMAEIPTNDHRLDVIRPCKKMGLTTYQLVSRISAINSVSPELTEISLLHLVEGGQIALLI